MTPLENTADTVYTSFIDGSTHRLTKSSLDVETQEKCWPVISPATNQPVCWFLPASEHEIDHAIQAATRAFEDKQWSHPSQAPFRAKILRTMATLLREKVDDLADWEVLQIGRPRKEMRFQLSRLPEWLDYFASLASVQEDSIPPFGPGYINHVRRVPLGVVAQITPFNHPLLITMKKLAPAIAAGNTVVIKPSELAPASIIQLATLCHDAGLPKGVMNVVLGGKDVCSRLIQHGQIAKVDFTGGPTTGMAIGEQAGRNLVQMTQELGGKAPMIVFAPPYVEQLDEPTVDQYLDPIVNGCAFGAFIASGQTCIAGTRILVQHSIYHRLVTKLVEKTKCFRMGNPMDMTTTLGPVITQRHMEWIDATVHSGMVQSDSKLQILCGGKRYQDFPASQHEFNEGNYYEPTVIAFDPSILGTSTSSSSSSPDPSWVRTISQLHHTNDIFQKELFGPVVVLAPFLDQEHAISLANDTDFSLGCSIWTNDLIQAHQVADQVQAGIVWINDHHKNHPSSPWGGLSKLSGIGRENGLEAFREYTQPKSVVVNCNPFTNDWFRDPEARYN
jgi:acyl-CoA reductase-like NAD-dependent aldehyde dehydrogenase